MGLGSQKRAKLHFLIEDLGWHNVWRLNPDKFSLQNKNIYVLAPSVGFGHVQLQRYCGSVDRSGWPYSSYGHGSLCLYTVSYVCICMYGYIWEFCEYIICYFYVTLETRLTWLYHVTTIMSKMAACIVTLVWWKAVVLEMSPWCNRWMEIGALQGACCLFCSFHP